MERRIFIRNAGLAAAAITTSNFTATAFSEGNAADFPLMDLHVHFFIPKRILKS